MAHPTLEYIRGRRAALATKKAEIVGENPSTMPGAEHDGTVPAEAKKPDAETKDQTMVPNSGLTTSGAGDDSKITHTNDLIAGEAALTPTKKPEVTGDADAKTAEKLAAEIIAGVDAWYAAKKQAEDAQAAQAAQAAQPAQAKQAEGAQAAQPAQAAQAAQPAQTAQAKQAEGAQAAQPAQAAQAAQAAQPTQTAQAKQAEGGVDNTKPTAGTPPSAGTGTAEALITNTGKEPDQTKAAIPPTKKPEITADATVPATGEGSSGETAAAAKAAGDEECCKDGKCGKCAKCKAAAKTAGALDMELTSDVLAKIAAVMLATEEGTKLAESVLAKAAGAEAAEKTLNFLRAQSDLAQKQAEYQAGQEYAVSLLKQAADAEAAGAAPAAGDGAAAAGEDDGGIAAVADVLDEMVDSGEITEDEADQVVVELAQALAAPEAADAGAAADAGGAAPAAAKTAQAAPLPGAADGAAAGDAAMNQAVAVDPTQLDPNSIPQGDMGDITPDDVASAIDTLVNSGEITEDEADQLVSEIVGADGGAGAAAGGEGDVSPEAIASALQEAVASGEISPEDVQQVLTELEGVPAPEGAQAAAAAPAAAAPAAAAPADEPKTAGAKLMAAINAVRAAKAAPAK